MVDIFLIKLSIKTVLIFHELKKRGDLEMLPMSALAIFIKLKIISTNG